MRKRKLHKPVKVCQRRCTRVPASLRHLFNACAWSAWRYPDRTDWDALFAEEPQETSLLPDWRPPEPEWKSWR